MKKTIILILFLFCLSVTAKASSLEEILANSESFDQKNVVVVGEVIGEVLESGGGYWINISFKGHSLGIFSPVEESFDSISHWGSYAETGDYLEISGRFNKNCSLHHTGDIHLESLEILKTGHRNKLEVSAQKVAFAMLGLIMCLIVSLMYFLKEKYGTKT